jgi:hypothetical protein
MAARRVQVLRRPRKPAQQQFARTNPKGQFTQVWRCSSCEKNETRPQLSVSAGRSARPDAGIDHTRRIFAQPAMARYSLQETVPGPGVATDEQFGQFARQAGTNVFHRVGTCKMGTDPMAVVDPRLRVHGIAGLRVIDASSCRR